MANPKLKLENISMRISSETKEYFEDLFQESGSSSKGEFLKVLMDKYSTPEESLENKKTKPETVEVEKIVEVEKVVEVEKKLDENEIIIRLNDLQRLILEILTTKIGCRRKSNEMIENVNNGIDNTFWGNKIYSGAYKGLFMSYNCEDSPEKIKEDMGAELVNNLMMVISSGGFTHLGIDANYINRIRQQIESEYADQFETDSH